ncbi:MAG: S8 family serine peptidase [Oceanospirillaceae bacterium]|nr:S8 family serine peptidase [Oceanospirillaceae bacterium]
MDSVIAAGYLGANVKVAVLDTGLEIAHEDLADNVVTNGSWNFVSNDTNPTNSAIAGDHGTSVAGLIAAVGWNGKGGRGVAPKASLKGFNILRNQTIGNYARALGGFQNSTDVDIFNQSFGVKVNYDISMNRYIEARYLRGVTSLRYGKGAIYVKSAGNGYEGISVSGTFIHCNTDYGADTGLTCQNANMDPWNTIPYNVVVGALNANGVKSSYSSAGSSIWVSAPGGEYGSRSPAMITTDQSNCAKGYVRAGGRAINAFDAVNNGVGHTQNLNCNYTSSFNGTSYSAPILAGAVALMLEANNSLTWRDVKHILATTAAQVDSTITDTVLAINGANYISEPRWLTNGAGYKFHNYYGFGGVDVARAVAAAKSYVSGTLGTFETSVNSSGAINLTIPNHSATGVSDTITVNEMNTIESIQLQVDITHESSGVLAIEVTSPSMTKSVLMTPLNVFGASDNLTDMVMLSNAFYGEPSQGNWTIKVVDPLLGRAGQLNQWQLKVFGHKGGEL